MFQYVERRADELSKYGQHLVPERRCFVFALGAFVLGVLGLRRRRRERCGAGQRWLCGANRIGRRKTVDQSGLQSRVHLLIGRRGLAGIGGMFVVRGGIEFLSHDKPPWRNNDPLSLGFPSLLATPAPAVYQGGAA